MPQYDGGPVSRIRSAPVRFPNQGGTDSLPLKLRKHRHRRQRQRNFVVPVRFDPHFAHQSVTDDDSVAFGDQREPGNECLRTAQTLHEQMLPMIAPLFGTKSALDHPTDRPAILRFFLSDRYPLFPQHHRVFDSFSHFTGPEPRLLVASPPGLRREIPPTASDIRPRHACTAPANAAGFPS